MFILFTISTVGALTILHSFDGTDGYVPEGITQGTSGTFYGTTVLTGTSDCIGTCGTVFSLAVGLGPFVRTLPTSGKVGSPVKILGSNLAGATGVSFNGTAAVFQGHLEDGDLCNHPSGRPPPAS